MSSKGAIKLGRVNRGATRRIRFTITKDQIPWNLSGGGATVTLRFEKPDRATSFVVTMTPENAAGGIFYYDTLTTDLDTPGYWTLGARVQDGPTDETYPDEISLVVEDQP